ncbi:MAG TPA: hypothetical protein VJI13_01120 [Candidatus Norongarragalinales archaeon]|nr:hypothetical protein [Candidatus Norongarragalinales archaeon]
MQKMKESYAYFSDKGSGTFECSEESVSMKGWKNMNIKKTHVMELTKMGDLPLNKVSVQMKYFDMFGGTETVEFAMREADYRAFKQALGK